MNKVKHPLWSFIKLTFNAYKPYYIVTVISCLFKAAEMVFNAYAVSILISYLEKGEESACYIAGAIIVGCNFFFYFVNKLFYRLNQTESMKLEVEVEQIISNKLMSVPFEKLEDPSFLDLKERAMSGVRNMGVVNRTINDFATIMENIFVLISLGAVMITFDYRLILILIAAILLDVSFSAMTMKIQIKFFNDLIPINRRFGYYVESNTNDIYAKDFRMYKGIGNMIKENYKLFEEKSLAEFESLYRKVSVVDCLQKVVGYVQLALVYIIIALRVIQGGLDVASFSLYVSAAISFTSAVIKLFDGGIDIIQCTQYVIPLNELLSAKDEKEIGRQIVFQGEIQTIEFKNVTFKYPKSDAVILNDISFKVSQGEKISIVGLNGAGKTTLVKLICRLYKPDKGEILINGMNINDYEYHSYISQISAVFQDFKLFAYTLKENILNGDGEEAVAYQTACKVGLKEKIDALPDGINSLYTKSFDEGGIELSGGEAQKVAIARAVYADSSLVILDEPTSALDPLAEADIYENFNSLVKTKTAFYISHRMSSSVFCDKILVLDGGRVSSFDTHNNLMKDKESLYYQLFTAQAKNYAE